MRILVVVDAPATIRHVAPLLPALADSGAVVMVAFNACAPGHHLDTGSVADPRVDWVGSFPVREDGWAPVARSLRGWMDVVRFFDERFEASPVLRDRMIRKEMPARPQTPVWSSAHTADVLNVLEELTALIPASDALRSFLGTLHPDVVVVTNLIDPQSGQSDIVQAARSSGIRTVYVVTNWDMLTNRGHIHAKPDVVVVWNERMRDEAIALHGMPDSAVRVAGAMVYDSWFARHPSCSREDFCARAGLPNRPFLMFAGSSAFIAPSELEVEFVRRWQAVVGEWPILVRPHRLNDRAWVTATIPHVVVWPRTTDDTPDTLFDSLSHCSAVVGINTSVMIEAAIVVKPVLTVLAQEFIGTQGGTLHFRHLREGGYVRIAATLEDHRRQLLAALADPSAIEVESHAFVTSFFRPHGLDVPHTPFVVSAILSTGDRC